jgi:hypothetical protein
MIARRSRPSQCSARGTLADTDTMSADENASPSAGTASPPQCGRLRLLMALVAAACLVESVTAWGLIAHGAALLSIKSPTRQLWFWLFAAGAVSLPAVFILGAGWWAPWLAVASDADGDCPDCRYALPTGGDRCPECGANDVLERRHELSLRAARATLRIAAGAVVSAASISILVVGGKALSEGSHGLPMVYLMLLVIMAWALNGTVVLTARWGGIADDGGMLRRGVRFVLSLLAVYLGVAASLNAFYIVRGPILVGPAWPWWLTTPPGSGTARWGWLWSIGGAAVVVAYACRWLSRGARRLAYAVATVVGSVAAIAFIDLVLMTLANAALPRPFQGASRLAEVAYRRMPPVFDLIHPHRWRFAVGFAMAMVFLVVYAAVSARRTVKEKSGR